MNWARSLLIAGVLVLLATGLLATSSYRAFLAAPLDIPGMQYRLEVVPGDSVIGVIRRLEDDGVLRDGWRWRLLLRLQPVTIQAGEYALQAGVTPREMLRKLSAGEVIQYRFTIVEGWTYRQLTEAILAESRLEADPNEVAPETVMQAIGSDADHPEGWFLPETYVYVLGDTGLELLQRAHAAMRRVLEQTWPARAGDLPLETPYELLILASIVERESSLAAERPEIAGVFVRRLQQGWRLETDPTVIYGMGDQYDGNIRRRDLRADTPYNTYTRHGLPPTPIALPSRSAIEAAAWPAAGSAMFFVADGSGGHVFSDTLEQHQEAVRRMLRRQREASNRGPDS